MEAVVKSISGLLIGSLALVLAAHLPVAAVEHPIKLEKDVDCASCHEDKTKGKAVHSAIAMGCTTCHEVKTEGETSTVNLISPKQEICLTCHEKSADAVLHAPYSKGECVTCHDPHTSDFAKQLRADGAKVCLECHADRGDAGDKVSLFKKFEISGDEFRAYPKVLASAEVQTGHPWRRHPVQGLPNPLKPQEKMSCFSCHEHHAASQQKLVITLPDKQDVCENCHQAVQKAKAAKFEKEQQEKQQSAPAKPEPKKSNSGGQQ
jgi:predicted CXXCH cytochrome family protein